jgi:hypothetical protein
VCVLAPPGIMDCPEAARLTALWSTAHETYQRAVSQLKNGTCPESGSPAYEVLQTAVEKARLDLDNVRVVLRMHREEHGC